ncbi:MAG TPA: hypothetical protein EYP10_01175 [Armatimonadetes bacterium]|nr:hypothetical protein [Armatimonadota bacterium]
MPYVRNEDVFRCPSAADEWQWNASCYPGLFKRKNLRVNYGYHEGIQINSWGSNKVAMMKWPAETVIVADCWNAFFTPWAWMQDTGVMVRSAFANRGWEAVNCGCHPTLKQGVNHEDWTRHLGGSNIGFADGHVKWVRWQNIKSKCRGGPLRISCRDIVGR